MRYAYGLETQAGEIEVAIMLAESDEQALSNLLEACSKSSLSPSFLENSETRVRIWESARAINPLVEGASLPLKKGETIAFEWKQGSTFYPVHGTINKIYTDWKSTNPAQKYLYQIKLEKAITITVPAGKLLTVKRTSMKNIEKMLM